MTEYLSFFILYGIMEVQAVVCLEGDACRVRAAILPPEVEGTLPADTSVACDLCDCWSELLRFCSAICNGIY